MNNEEFERLKEIKIENYIKMRRIERNIKNF